MKVGRFGAAWRWIQRYLSLTLLLAVGVIAFVLFFNDNSVMKIYGYEQQILELQAEIRENRDTLLYYEALNARLHTDRATMERIVREQYHMQRPGEDVYLTD